MFIFKHNGKVYEAPAAKPVDMSAILRQKIKINEELNKLGKQKTKPDKETLDFWLEHSPNEKKRVVLLKAKQRINDILNKANEGSMGGLGGFES